ncbi:Tat pathway signal sequence domain protein [Streptomyces capparidis]
MPDIPRRSLIATAAVAGAAGQLSWAAPGRAAAAPAAPRGTEGPVEVRWLEPGGPGRAPGSTWGVPWPKGRFRPGQAFALRTSDGTRVPVQTWTTGYWPDGSLKWTAHAVGGAVPAAESYLLEPGRPAAHPTALKVHRGGGHVTVDTGVVSVRIPRSGSRVVDSITRGGKEIAGRGELVLLRQDAIADGDRGEVRWERFTSAVTRTTVEQDGPVRAVVRVEGKHRKGNRSWLPFSIRLYFHAGSEAVRMVHTIVWDGDQDKDFVRGLGVRFAVPMRDEPHNRHIRLGGEGDGMLYEAVRGITGLRRDPGKAVRDAQVAGRPTPDTATWDTRVSSRLHLIPTWSDYTLSQLSADGFTVRKRTKAGHGWIAAGGGRRASGFGYVGGAGGGLSFGLRDFWQRHPTQLDVRGAATDTAEVTVWLWSPEAQPMDLRFYHDGMGQDTFPEQLEGLQITYEDYEPGFGTPYGIARTSELTLWAMDATPSAEVLAGQAAAVRTPPQLVVGPEHLHAAGVFGDWAPVDRSTPAKAEIEDHLDFLFSYYKGQVEQRRWYGFWDYGDIMHTYDVDRHQWRYDVGGYAWDNSELSPDLWLWYAYLRSGRAEVFRFAEAMTRHTGEVDVYHLGKWAGLGTRHGVQHFADSAKQQRISTAAYRRFHYFLTADERVGDLMRDLVDSDRTFLVLDPLRKIRTEPYEPDPHALAIGLGTDWSGLAAAWLTEWERGGPQAETARKKLLATMRTIARMPNGFVTGGGLYDIDTGEFAEAQKKTDVSHLSAMFGQVEMCSELISIVDMPDFEKAWLQYCRLYGATPAEQEAETGKAFGNLILKQGHSRLTAYAAVRLRDDKLAARAWREFYTGDGYGTTLPWKAQKLTGPAALVPGEEATFVDTNTTALYGLAAIQNLALIGDRMPT